MRPQLELWFALGFVFALPGCGGGENSAGGSGGHAGVPYAIEPVAAELAAETIADHEVPAIAIGKNGVEIAAWQVRRSNETAGLLYSVFDGLNWGHEGFRRRHQARLSSSDRDRRHDLHVRLPVLIETGSGAVRPGMRALWSGNALAVTWTQDVAGTDHAFANVYNGVWGKPTRLETKTGLVYGAPALGRCGDVYCAAWSQKDPGSGVQKMWTASF